MKRGPKPKYTKELLDKAWLYLDNYSTKCGHTIPSIVGLARVLKITSKTLHEWRHDPKKKELSDILDFLKDGQHLDLINGGLSGSLNAAICKLALGKHGYHEKQDTTLTGAEGGALKVDTTWQVKVVD